MHWNVNSIPAHDFSRISLLVAYNSIHDFQLIAITETALKNNIPNDKIDIPGYSPIRCDLPGNDTHGGVLIYHKLDLSVKNRADLCSISNTIVLELSISRKKKLCCHTGNMVKQTKSLVITQKNLAKLLTKLIGRTHTPLLSLLRL